MPNTFKCPMCAAPLDVSDSSSVTVRCPYCENTVILPEELRRGGSASGVNNDVGQTAGASFAPMIDQALKMAEVARLLRAGNKIAAIKLYRETYGVGLKDAKDAVERIERGEPITFTQASVATGRDALRPSPGRAQLMPEHAIRQKRASGGRCLIVSLILIVATVGAFLLFGGGTAYWVFRQGQSSVPSSPSTKPTANSFANVALEFGSEGIGAGQFKDARSVAVDGQGRIYTAEYIGGRVQVFDAQGKFLTQWMVEAKRPLPSMAADRKGSVYIVQGGSIIRYEGSTGERLGEVESRGPGFNQNYSTVYVALDGSLYAVAANHNIVHLGADGKIKTIINAEEKTGDNLHLDGLAVSGSGHIYALDRSERSVLKFAPDGKYINRFGGAGDGVGQLRSPQGIAVDGQGRIYVCDVGRAIQVFDANGRYLESFAPNEVIFEIAINDQNEIFASQRNRHKIVKYVLSKP